MTRLRWCVGRFAYATGRHHLYHFMELKDFMVEDGPEYAYLFSVRALRAGGGRLPALGETLTYWMENTPAPVLAETISRVITTVQDTPATVIEYYPGVGVTFEYLKHLLEERQPGHGSRFKYVGCGNEAFRSKFSTLHADEYSAAYVSDDAIAALPAAGHACVVYNHAEAVREGYEPRISLTAIIAGTPEPSSLVVCARVVSGALSQETTTVRGSRVTLPGVTAVRELCETSGGLWTYRYIEEFDPGFFLPGLVGRAGLLVACRTPQPVLQPGFGSDVRV